MIVTRLSYWNCLIWGYLRLNHLIFWGKLRFRNVGNCGEMWGIVGDCGVAGRHFRFWDVGNLECTDCGVCKFSQILAFPKIFLILTFFMRYFFLLKIVNLTNYRKKWHFPYTLQIFPMCVSNTLLQNPTVFLTDC